MRHWGHKAAAYDGYGLAVERRESRRLFDRTDEGLSQRADNREYLARRHRAAVSFDRADIIRTDGLLCAKSDRTADKQDDK